MLRRIVLGTESKGVPKKQRKKLHGVQRINSCREWQKISCKIQSRKEPDPAVAWSPRGSGTEDEGLILLAELQAASIPPLQPPKELLTRPPLWPGGHGADTPRWHPFPSHALQGTGGVCRPLPTRCSFSLGSPLEVPVGGHPPLPAGK